MRLGTNGVHRVIPPSTTAKTRCPMLPALLYRHGFVGERWHGAQGDPATTPDSGFMKHHCSPALSS